MPFGVPYPQLTQPQAQPQVQPPAFSGFDPVQAFDDMATQRQAAIDAAQAQYNDKPQTPGLIKYGLPAMGILGVLAAALAGGDSTIGKIGAGAAGLASGGLRGQNDFLANDEQQRRFDLKVALGQADDDYNVGVNRLKLLQGLQPQQPSVTDQLNQVKLNAIQNDPERLNQYLDDQFGVEAPKQPSLNDMFSQYLRSNPDASNAYLRNRAYGKPQKAGGPKLPPDIVGGAFKDLTDATNKYQLGKTRFSNDKANQLGLEIDPNNPMHMRSIIAPYPYDPPTMEGIYDQQIGPRIPALQNTYPDYFGPNAADSLRQLLDLQPNQSDTLQQQYVQPQGPQPQGSNMLSNVSGEFLQQLLEQLKDDSSTVRVKVTR